MDAQIMNRCTQIGRIEVTKWYQQGKDYEYNEELGQIGILALINRAESHQQSLNFFSKILKIYGVDVQDMNVFIRFQYLNICMAAFGTRGQELVK